MRVRKGCGLIPSRCPHGRAEVILEVLLRLSRIIEKLYDYDIAQQPPGPGEPWLPRCVCLKRCDGYPVDNNLLPLHESLGCGMGHF